MSKESGVVLRSVVFKMCLDTTICTVLENNVVTACAGRTVYKDLSSICFLEQQDEGSSLWSADGYQRLTFILHYMNGVKYVPLMRQESKTGKFTRSSLKRFYSYCIFQA